MMATFRISSSDTTGGSLANPSLVRIGFVLLLIQLAGCGPQTGSPYKLDRSLAIESLQLFMETWRDNGSLDSLKSRNPSIVGKDADWKNGAKLVSFVIPQESRDDGTNLYIDVQLELVTSKGEKRQKTIRYVVGTQPVVSIFRDD